MEKEGKMTKSSKVSKQDLLNNYYGSLDEKLL